MGLVVKDDGWRIPDWLWAEIEPLLPERPAHPLGCHNPRGRRASTPCPAAHRRGRRPLRHARKRPHTLAYQSQLR